MPSGAQKRKVTKEKVRKGPAVLAEMRRLNRGFPTKLKQQP